MPGAQLDYIFSKIYIVMLKKHCSQKHLNVKKISGLIVRQVKWHGITLRMLLQWQTQLPNAFEG